jgi:hypothetical protein
MGLLACVVCYSLDARAQTSTADRTLATQLFDDAERLMDEDRPGLACPKYAESQRRDPQLGTLLHLADCYERIGRTASAWVAFKDAIEIATSRNATGANEPREQTARGRAARLEGLVSRLIISVAQPDIDGLEIRHDGELVVRAAWGSAVPVDPGSYTITASAPRKKSWTQIVTVGSNAVRANVIVPMLEDEPGLGSPSQRTVRAPVGELHKGRASGDPAENTAGNAQRVFGLVVGGVGVASLATGAVFGLLRNDNVARRDAICPSDKCTLLEASRIEELSTTAKSNAMAFNVAAGIGATALVMGVVLVLTAPRTAPGSATGVRLDPWMTASSAGVRLGSAW